MSLGTRTAVRLPTRWSKDASAARMRGRRHVAGGERLPTADLTRQRVVLTVRAGQATVVDDPPPRRAGAGGVLLSQGEAGGGQVTRQVGQRARAPVAVGGTDAVAQLRGVEVGLVGLGEGPLEVGTVQREELPDPALQRTADLRVVVRERRDDGDEDSSDQNSTPAMTARPNSAARASTNGAVSADGRTSAGSGRPRLTRRSRSRISFCSSEARRLSPRDSPFSIGSSSSSRRSNSRSPASARATPVMTVPPESAGAAPSSAAVRSIAPDVAVVATPWSDPPPPSSVSVRSPAAGSSSSSPSARMRANRSCTVAPPSASTAPSTPATS